MSSILSAALCMLAAFDSHAEWIAPTPSAPRGPEPHWIWAQVPAQPAPTTENAPEGTVWLTKSFEVDGPSARSAKLALAVDNSATAYLNGVKVLAASEWSTPEFASVELRAGTNVLSIEARNGGAKPPPGAALVNPGGVIVRLQFFGADGLDRWVASDASWSASAAKWSTFPGEPERSASLEHAVDLGASSISPWNLSRAAFESVPPCPILRRTFELDDAAWPVASAKVRVIGLGHYELRCNGRVVGATLLNQAWSEYSKTLYWQEFDLSRELVRGENVLAVSLGNSFWRVDRANDAGRFTKTDAMPDFSNGWPHLLWLDATLETKSGERRVVSDAQWKWTRGPLTFSNVYAGEDYDARLEPNGWDSAGFDDRAWSSVVVAPAPSGAPTKLDGPAIQAFDVFDAREIRSPSPDVYTYVFPQNCSSMLRYTLRGGASGARVRFEPCEYMDDSGRVKFTYTWGTGKDIWFDYTVRGGATEKHQTVFCYVGAQFVQVEGAVPAGRSNPKGLPVLESLQLVHVRAACNQVGSFECSSELQNGAERLIDWSMRSNMSYFPTDCPHREKNSWIEQDWHMARALSYRYGVFDWLSKTCRDIRDTQLPDGHVPTNSPNYLVGIPPHGFWNEAPEWGIASVLVPWHLYEWYGDRKVLEANFESAKRYVDYLTSTAKDGAITSNLGDWYDYGHGKGNGPSQWTPAEVSATEVWADGADTLARIANVLDRKSDAAKYAALREQIGRDFLRRFYDARTHTVSNHGSCQAGTTTAIVLGLIPPADRELALDAVVADLAQREWQQTSGEVLQVFLIRALAENGRGDALHRIYDRKAVGSYGFMVASGLTTLPESWDARRGTGDSLNHFMLGHLLEWHYAYVAGIRQRAGSVGWNDVLIAPQPPPLDLLAANGSPSAIRKASASFESPRGRIESVWEIADRTFSLHATIPNGIRAEALLPDGTRRALAPGANELKCELRAPAAK